MTRAAKKVTAERAEANAAALAAMWDIGDRSRRRAAGPMPQAGFRRELAAARADAAELGLSWLLGPGTLGKVRRVAVDYTRAEVDAVAARVRRHRSRFGPTHMARLLAVRDPAVRGRILGLAVRGSWPFSALDRAVQAARGGRRGGTVNGRPPYVPPDPAELRSALEGVCLRWLRWTGEAAGTLPDDLRELVRAADAAVEAVRRKAGPAGEQPTGGPGRRRTKPVSDG